MGKQFHSSVGAVLVIFGVLTRSAGAADPPAPGAFPLQREGDFIVKNFKFQTGEAPGELPLHYTTVGSPHRDARGGIDNAVLLLHGTTGTGKNFLSASLGGQLFGAGQPLDANRFYVIMPDGIGRGGSSKPSDGLRAKFPRYGYGDVVEGQHRLVTEGLGVKNLELIVGTSMGGMQAWMWAERYPDAAKAIMPIASQPVEVSGRNLLWRRLVTEAIRSDPEWNGGNYDRQPSRFTHFMPIFNIMTDSPVRLQEQAPTRAKANALYDGLIASYAKFDANDCLYWFESSYDYNPSPELEKIKAKVLAVNFADDELNPVELGVMEREMKRVAHGRLVTIPAGPTSRGHQSLTQAVLWGKYVTELLGERRP
jgi:homoserine O-acetyltransferase/O-succinyltransferase